jgi:hypothetical protein
VAITTYAELQTAGANWLGGRSDLTARIPEFIALAEAQIARDLRRFTTRATITLSVDQNNLPSDCRELKSIRLVTDSSSQDKPLIISTVEELAFRRAQTGDAPGRPLRCAVFNNGTVQALLTQPTPDGVYNAEVFYYQKLVPLSATNTTSTVLTEAPDLYLFGLLKEAEPFLENDERVQMWEAKYAAALSSLLMARDREEWQASQRPLPLARVFS